MVHITVRTVETSEEWLSLQHGPEKESLPPVLRVCSPEDFCLSPVFSQSEPESTELGNIVAGTVM